MKDKHSTALRLAIAAVMVSGVSLFTEALGQAPNVIIKGGTAIYTVPAAERQATTPADIGNARAMPLPAVDLPPLDPLNEAQRRPQVPQGGPPGFSPGAPGTGVQSPVTVPPESSVDRNDAFQAAAGDVSPSEYGAMNLPYTTSRVDTVVNNVSSTYPYRAAGRLYFLDGTNSYVCSASLIKRGVAVTAGHCVAKFGTGRYYTNFQFVPAQYNTSAPYGVWNAEAVMVRASYLNGTDPCSQRGVVCANDVALIRIAPQGGAFPGSTTGWFGYGWNGYGFTPGNTALISQLGYPTSHDLGTIMQRTDAQGVLAAAYTNNTVWGSRQTGGSSGGPELVNLGIRGALNIALGSEPNPNTVVGVTSWGTTNTSLKMQGASPFTTNNIVPLLTAACISGTTTRPACR